MIFDRITDLIGNTPLLRLPLKNTQWQLLLKMEKFNPGLSMKDRMARNMIDDSEKSGCLKPGGQIFESSSGNTGTGLAIVAAERGYKFTAIVDHHAAQDKIRIMKAYGANIMFVGGDFAEDEVATAAREKLAYKLSLEHPGSVCLQQADNPANAQAYYKTMGREIFSSTNGCLDMLIGSVGTGGSLSGTARYLKECSPNIKVIGVEPVGSIAFGGPPAPYFQSGTGTPGSVDVGKNIDYNLIDEGLTVSDAQAFNTARFLAHNNGILVGGAAGGVIYKALEIIQKQPGYGVMVVIVGDGGEKYLDTVFNDEWMQSKGLLSPSIEEELKAIVGNLKFIPQTLPELSQQNLLNHIESRSLIAVGEN